MVRHPTVLMIPPLAVAKPGKAFLNRTPHINIKTQKECQSDSRDNLREEPNFFCTDVSSDFVSLDKATVQPMIVLSPAQTKVDARARLCVSIGFSEVEVIVPGVVSLVGRERSKRKSKDASIMRMSAGT